jgi:hypothetical protein
MATISGVDFNTKIKSLIGKIQIGGKTVNIKLNSKAQATPFVKEICEEQIKSYLADKVFFTRVDIAEEVAKIINPPRKYEKIIQKLRGLLDEKDIGALFYAARICQKENKSESEGEIEIRRMAEAYGNRGRTIYNWLRSEDVFPIDILPIIESKQNFPDKESFNAIFRRQWEELIKFHPWRLFVKRGLPKEYQRNEEDLREEILKRFIFWEMREVFIYSRKSRNKIAKKVARYCLAYLGEHPRIAKKSYKIGNDPALRIKIYKKKIVKNQ